MDSRVAAMVADILFEMQRSENNIVEIKTFCPPLNLTDTLKQFDKFKVNQHDSETIIKQNGNLKIDLDRVQDKSKSVLEQEKTNENNSKNDYQTNVDKNMLLNFKNNLNENYNAVSFPSIVHQINGTNENVTNDNDIFLKV